jgi:putative flippase GtrA
MAQSGFRLWVLAVAIAAAVTLITGHFLRMRLPGSTADAIAQAIGFTTSFIVAWPWFRAHNPRRLSFVAYLAVVAALALITAVLRIRYLA